MRVAGYDCARCFNEQQRAHGLGVCSGGWHDADQEKGISVEHRWGARETGDTLRGHLPSTRDGRDSKVIQVVLLRTERD